MYVMRLVLYFGLYASLWLKVIEAEMRMLRLIWVNRVKLGMK